MDAIHVVAAGAGPSSGRARVAEVDVENRRDHVVAVDVLITQKVLLGRRGLVPDPHRCPPLWWLIV